ncbi:MAG TPA: hypothetical protein ENO20_10695 [Bacteroides sp.]|nr:hypothetical protein [Bacteroides sp.]
MDILDPLNKPGRTILPEMKNKPDIALLLIVLAILGMACSPSNRQRVLSFFFDGVPEPERDSVRKTERLAPGIEEEVLDSAKIAWIDLVVSNHAPYRDKKCTSCHDPYELGTLVSPEPALCYGCHEDFTTRFTRLHGPVDAGFCSSCHLPHQSRNEQLLIAPGNDLCFPCHPVVEVERLLTHRDIGNEPCILCHDPHGARDSYIRPKAIPLER